MTESDQTKGSEMPEEVFDLVEMGDLLTVRDRKYQDEFRIIAGRDSGAFAQVYSSFNTDGRVFAVKMLRRPQDFEHARLDYEMVRQYFFAEAVRLSKLNHSNVVDFHGFDIHEDTPFYVMEFVPETLADVDMSDATLKQYLRQMTRFLQFTRKKGIIHADLKPENIGIAGNGQFKVLDFGSAVSDDEVFQVERMFTTPLFSPPEYRAQTLVTTSFDIYCFGRTLEAFLAGHPFRDTEASLECATEIYGDVPDSLADICRQTTHKDWWMRPDVHELKDLVSTYIKEVKRVRLFTEDKKDAYWSTHQPLPIEEMFSLPRGARKVRTLPQYGIPPLEDRVEVPFDYAGNLTSGSSTRQIRL